MGDDLTDGPAGQRIVPDAARPRMPSVAALPTPHPPRRTACPRFLLGRSAWCIIPPPLTLQSVNLTMLTPVIGPSKTGRSNVRFEVERRDLD